VEFLLTLVLVVASLGVGLAVAAGALGFLLYLLSRSATIHVRTTARPMESVAG
jgi:hypothetical protein